MVEYTYGNKELTFAKEAYYNIFGNKIDLDGMREFLVGRYSQYAMPRQNDFITGKREINISEITAELFACKRVGDMFLDEFLRLWRKKGQE